MTLPLFATQQPDPVATRSRAQRLFDVATILADNLTQSQIPTRHALRKLMTASFGASDAQGAWSMRQAYDALEIALILFLRRGNSGIARSGDPTACYAALRRLETSLPTHSYRSEQQIAMQQFSTPLTLAWLAVQAARLGPEDHILEPSAGTGMLLGSIPPGRCTFTLNERDPDRAALLTLAIGQAVTCHDAEYIHDLLPLGNDPSVVLINPPFGRSEGRGNDRQAGVRHLRSALLRLRQHGRCVAIMPPGFAADGSGAKAYATIAQLIPPRVEITILGSPFAKHGTGIAVRLLLFDKGWHGQGQSHVADNLDAALDLVLALPDRLDPPALLPPPPLPKPPSPAVAFHLPRPKAKDEAASLFRTLSATPLAAPARIAANNANAVPLSYAVRDTPLPVGDPVGIYAPWRLARIAIEGATPHPDKLVESLAMGSVLPPVPRWQPLLQPRALAALSEAQLETIIHAGEAFSRDLPGMFTPNAAGDQLHEDPAGRAYRTGYFIGDGTGVGKGREGAGLILDQWNRGNRRAIWISRSAALLEDARRDWSALGC